MTQRVIPITSPLFIPPQHLEAEIDWSGQFGAARPLALEIGCGTGHFVLELAQRHPERNFLAIDIYNKGCLKTCNRLEAAGLTNVRVSRVEARYLLSKAVAPNSLSAIYINCPDPWPKKRHRQRRLVNRDFLQTAWHYLAPDGDFYFSSDCADYAEDVAHLVTDLPGYRNQLAQPLVTDLPGYPLSKYMRRFLAQGLPIHFVHQRRDPQVTAGQIPLPEVARGFRADWRQAENA